MISLQKLFPYLLALTIALRFLHFGDALDGPHVWRQADTGHFIRDFYENGIDLLHPAVCWMGGHRTLALEFPLPEAVVAIGYHITDENHQTARVVFLVFFLLSAIYLRKSLALFFKDGIPELATLIYCITPLSLFYSRAVHVDFTAVAFTHLMFFYVARGCLNSSKKDLLIGTTWATLAFVVKAPYAFYFIFPLGMIVWNQRKLNFVIRHAFLALFPVGFFLLWRWHSGNVNALAPDWNFIPGYNPFTDMWYWYFGTWEQRTQWELWDNIGKRLHMEITGNFGGFLLLVGTILGTLKWSGRMALIWLLSVVLYVSIFFNLNVIHNYYQIPFIAPLAVLMAIGISRISLMTKKFSPISTLLLLTFFGFESYSYSEENYFRPMEVQSQISEVIEKSSSPKDLVVISYGGLSPQFPNLIYGAHRTGWSIPIMLQSPTLLYKLKDEGATVAYFISKDRHLYGEMGRFIGNHDQSSVIEIEEAGLRVVRVKL